MRNERKESFCVGRINAQGLPRLYGARISAPLCKGSWLFGLFYKPKRLRGCIGDK